MRDEADLDVPMIGVELAPNGGAIVFGLVLVMLVAFKPALRSYAAHSAVIGPGADGAERLFERDLNFETQDLQPDDLRRGQGHFCAQGQNFTAVRMQHRASSLLITIDVISPDKIMGEEKTASAATLSAMVSSLIKDKEHMAVELKVPEKMEKRR